MFCEGNEDPDWLVEEAAKENFDVLALQAPKHGDRETAEIQTIASGRLLSEY